MIKISCVIITYNEEKNIQQCLESILKVADEVILVDSYSQDKTVALAQNMGARIFYKKFMGFGDQKAFAVEQASYDWIISIDADEILSEELTASILAIKNNPQADGYYINILTNYCGKWIKHCGWYPKHKLRLLNKNKGHINRNKVHEGFEMNNAPHSLAHLDGDLLHHSYNTISEHSRKIQLYTELAAKHYAENGISISLLKIIFGPRWTFFYHYIIRKGFLDGYWGYVLCKNISYESFIKYTKIRLYARQYKKTGVVA
ncbi:MAG: glycosyltransferase family 2 protein [Taibaiella sp.]|nr:glycosyltransferase family 2 protein [Taibaiella sp.]